MFAAAVACVVASGCRGATSAPAAADSAPRFVDAVVDQTWTLGAAVRFRLPSATGGDGRLSYSLGLELPPGLAFQRDRLRIDGTPTAAGVYPMRYRVTDADDNDADRDGDVLTFRITVQEPAPPDTAPRFAQPLADLFLLVGEAVSLTLPAATGGNPPLSYSLEPELPQGLAFDGETRELSGTPAAAGGHDMAYRVVDGDPAPGTGDADELRFSITVAEVPEGAYVAAYDAAAGGDQVFTVDMEALPPDRFSFALDLRAATDEVRVYLISTNPTADPLAAPEFATGAATAPATEERNPAEREQMAASPHEDFVVELNNNPPVPRGGGTAARSSVAARQAPPRIGTRLTFRAIDFELQAIVRVRAAARAVVADPTLPATFVVWVADASWGARCDQVHCVTQRMVDELAATFLQAGPGNDIYDWVTAVFGEPWGPHDYSGELLDPATEQLHVLLHDIDQDNSTTGGTLGYFTTKDVYLPRPGLPPIFAHSNRKLMFYLDSVLLATPDEGQAWDPRQRWPGQMTLTLAHEFQHLIHFYQKKVRHDFEAVSEAWLNEVASEVADDLVSGKLGLPGARGVAGEDGSAGEPGNSRGRLPRYNLWNDIQVSTWNGWLANYSIAYALGAYLARTYGAELFTEIVQSGYSGVAAVEAALPGGLSFGQILADWAVANVLSDDPAAPLPYRYNSGGWTATAAGGLPFDLGSINLYHYDSVGRFEGPFFHSVGQLNRRGEQEPHSNIYVDLGSHAGLLEGEIGYAAGAQLTLVVRGYDSPFGLIDSFDTFE